MKRRGTLLFILLVAAAMVPGCRLGMVDEQGVATEVAGTVIARSTARVGALPTALVTRAPGATPTPQPSPTSSREPATPTALPTATPSVTPTATRAPTATPRPTRTPTRTATATPCLPGAGFVSDVTVPDGTQLQPGAQFTKAWRMRSNGCAAWPAGSVWAFVDGDQMGAPTSVPVSTVPIAGTIDISVQMTAPGTPGTYMGTWQLQSPDGTRFGDQAYVSIVVPLLPPRQLKTGTIIRQAGARNGQGQLSIGNGLDLDAVAVLQRNDSAVLVAVYVRGQDSFTLTSIPDGTYELYFTLGEDWDSTEAKFTRRRNLSRFDDPFPFQTTATTYSTWSVTLHPVAGGTAGTESVPEGEFPDLR